MTKLIVFRTNGDILIWLVVLKSEFCIINSEKIKQRRNCQLLNVTNVLKPYFTSLFYIYFKELLAPIKLTIH